MRAAFEPLVLYPYGPGGLDEDALTTTFVVPAAEGDVLLYRDGSMAQVEEIDPETKQLQLKQYGDFPFLQDPSPGDRQFWIYPHDERAKELVERWISSVDTGIRAKR